MSVKVKHRLAMARAGGCPIGRARHCPILRSMHIWHVLPEQAGGYFVALRLRALIAPPKNSKDVQVSMTFTFRVLVLVASFVRLLPVLKHTRLLPGTFILATVLTSTS